MMHVAGMVTADIANGPGIRTSLFVSGCRLHCPGCHNERLWDFGYGVPFDMELMDKIEASLRPSWVSGLSILGGEPFEPENRDWLTQIVRTLRAKEWFGGKDVWVYTGWDVKDTWVHPLGLIECADYLVDGPYIDGLRDPSLAFRGSSNQRIWTMGAMGPMDVTDRF